MATEDEERTPICPECGWPFPDGLARCAGCNYPDPIPSEPADQRTRGVNDRPVIGCGGWMRDLKKIPPRLPFGGDDPVHYRELHPEITLVHRTLHEQWARQIAALEQFWAAV